MASGAVVVRTPPGCPPVDVMTVYDECGPSARCSGQADLHVRTARRTVVCGHRPAMFVDKGGHDGQTESGTFLSVGARGVRPAEPLEGMREKRLGEARPGVRHVQHHRRRALRLSEKTRVVHIDDGFDFLGFNIRRMRRRGSNKWFVYTRPSKKAIASIKGWVKTMTYRATLHHDPGYLMDYLGRVLRGWANYFRRGVSKATFSAIDSYAWERITVWLRDKHKIGWPELRRRFCLPGTWRLAVDGIRFKGAASVPVIRYRYRGYRIPTPWTPSATTS